MSGVATEGIHVCQEQVEASKAARPEASSVLDRSSGMGTVGTGVETPSTGPTATVKGGRRHVTKSEAQIRRIDEWSGGAAGAETLLDFSNTKTACAVTAAASTRRRVGGDLTRSKDRGVTWGDEDGRGRRANGQGCGRGLLNDCDGVRACGTVFRDEGTSMGVAGARTAHRGHGKSGGVAQIFFFF